MYILVLYVSPVLMKAPEVYKDPSEIITGIQDTVKILEIIKPILSIKAGTGDGED